MHEAGVRLNVLFGGGVGFAASGIFGSIGAYLTELFPSDVRANGQGYNFGRGIGALFPSLAGYLGQTHGLAWAFGVFTTTAYGVVIIAALMRPETKGRIRE
ncbi:probable transporter (partial) [Bordetella avium 197N]|uniref:Probable transporter (Partial) n=1 Tax=Bordetella avium (strain 197N) TaxID=360910 RepID=Q2KU08_BORA1|nr:probable transporter (partial) [Bordetella avium 197N]